jgi:hypothetical protein
MAFVIIRTIVLGKYFTGEEVKTSGLKRKEPRVTA